MTTKELLKRIEDQEKVTAALIIRVEKLETKKGPASSREMTLDDAERVINGNLKDTSHKDAAKKLGLSYGQVYSARGGYTFKGVVKEK